MNLVLNERRSKARKPHSCWFCGQQIKVGERYDYRTGVNAGDFWTMHMHLECNAWATAKWEEYDYEGHSPGDMPRPTREDLEAEGIALIT